MMFDINSILREVINSKFAFLYKSVFPGWQTVKVWHLIVVGVSLLTLLILVNKFKR